MKKTIITVTGLGLMLGFAMPAMAFADDYRGRPGMHEKFDRMADVLELTDEQRQQFRRIHRQARPKLQEIGEAMQDNREALHRLSPADDDYAAKVARLARKQGELVEKMIRVRSRVRAEVYAILTPDQREKAKQMRHHASRPDSRGSHQVERPPFPG
ncbi:MAG: Spy/CpxP family protein refolding chaperone [Mariprofundaceae bacterium]|nr:Spy/CpxP family protein refolding chaperone [Mariprofundaceae bacterium]